MKTSSRHGPELETFELHETETFRKHSCYSDTEGHCGGRKHGVWYEPSLYLDTSQVRKLSQLCRNLTEIVDILSEATSLRQLKLRFESPNHADEQARRLTDDGLYRGHNRYHDPLINKTSVPKIFHKANTRASNKRLPRLELMEILVGEWDGRHIDYGMMEPRQVLLGCWDCGFDGDGQQFCGGGNAFPGYGGKKGLKEPYWNDLRYGYAGDDYGGYDNEYHESYYDEEYEAWIWKENMEL